MKLWHGLVSAALFFAAGCVNIDYVGQELAPLPDGRLVTFYDQGVDYDAARYRQIGRATVTAPDGTGMLDIKEDLQDKARAVGADAVKIVSFARINTGVAYITNAQGDDMPQSADSANQSREIGGAPVYTDSFGQTGDLVTSAKPQYKVVLEVQFLADAATVDAAMSERKEMQAREAREISEARAAEKIAELKAEAPAIKEARETLEAEDEQAEQEAQEIKEASAEQETQEAAAVEAAKETPEQATQEVEATLVAKETPAQEAEAAQEAKVVKEVAAAQENQEVQEAEHVRDVSYMEPNPPGDGGGQGTASE